MYWINIVSAVLDNATLAAAEISPAMDTTTISNILMGLLISGGMLIPGNTSEHHYSRKAKNHKYGICSISISDWISSNGSLLYYHFSSLMS